MGIIVTNLARPAERVVAFYNQRGTAEQYIKEGKNAIKRTRLSCRTFAANAVRLQLHVLAYNLGNFMRTLADARIWLARMSFDLGHDTARPLPALHLIAEAGEGAAHLVRRPPDRALQQVSDPVLQDAIGRQLDRVV